MVLIAGAIAAWGYSEPEVAPPPLPEEEAAECPALARQAPEATPEDRAARRLNRYDRDNDGQVSRGEYLSSRQKAFARLDANGDGRLDFEEYAAKTALKFAEADEDRSGLLSAEEFASTAPKRRPKPKMNCPQVGLGDT